MQNGYWPAYRNLAAIDSHLNELGYMSQFGWGVPPGLMRPTLSGVAPGLV